MQHKASREQTILPRVCVIHVVTQFEPSGKPHFSVVEHRGEPSLPSDLPTIQLRHDAQCFPFSHARKRA